MHVRNISALDRSTVAERRIIDGEEEEDENTARSLGRGKCACLSRTQAQGHQRVIQGAAG